LTWKRAGAGVPYQLGKLLAGHLDSAPNVTHMIGSFNLPKHCHLIAGEFEIVSNEMKTSPVCLGDYQAIERVAMESGKQRQRENVVERYRSSTSPFCCCWSRSTSASGRRRASLPSCIFIWSSQTLARLKCKLFAGDWHASRTALDSFAWSPSHQMNEWGIEEELHTS
jgi:hypothetical protein